MATIIGIIVIVFVVGIIFAVFYFRDKAVVKRGLRRYPQTRIGSFSDGGLGSVKGQVVASGQLLVAPLSGRKCVYYRVIVEEYRSSGKSGSWYKIIDDVHSGTVLITDGSGYALINATKSRSHIVADAKYTSGTFNDATPELENFLQQHNRKSTGMLNFNKSLRYKEGILEENEMIAVGGKGEWKDARSLGFDLPVPQVLVITEGENAKLFLTDDASVMN
ncbi:MAG: hypothetical protein ACRC3B_11720 [Bacteroidia bacterium]